MRPYAERPYRRGVGMLLLNSGGEAFVGQRIDKTAEAWQMPQGGIDEDETPQTAALRELAEEIGTDKAAIIAESTDWISYDLPEAIADRVWGGRYRGQAQKWFALRFTGRDSDIRVLDVPHPEFSDWKWVRPNELMELIVPFKRELYRRVIAEFGDLLG